MGFYWNSFDNFLNVIKKKHITHFFLFYIKAWKKEDYIIKYKFMNHLKILSLLLSFSPLSFISDILVNISTGQYDIKVIIDFMIYGPSAVSQ